MSEYDEYDEIERIAEQRRMDAEADKVAESLARLQQRQAAQQPQKDTQEVIRGLCEANGTTQQEWQEMVSDPEISRVAYLKSVRDYARRVTKRKRNSRGQFVASGGPSGDQGAKWEVKNNDEDR
jgi:hypothetical protein